MLQLDLFEPRVHVYLPEICRKQREHQHMKAVLNNCVCSALLLIAKLGWDFLARTDTSSYTAQDWHQPVVPGTPVELVLQLGVTVSNACLRLFNCLPGN